MKEIAPVLEKLAEQLGTTSEYLWKVLLKQAPINSAIDIIQYGLIALGCIFWWKFTKRMSTKIEDGNWDEVNYVWIGAGWVILGILIVVTFFCIHETATGFIHPEYWALNRILDKIK